MTDQPLPDILDDLATLLRSQLGIRGTGFRAKLRRAGRLLPRRVRVAGDALLEMERLWENPKLRRRINPQDVHGHVKVIRDHLNGIDPVDRRKAFWISIAAPLAFNLLILFIVVLLVVTYWDPSAP